MSLTMSLFFNINFELVANLATAWKPLVASQTILVPLATVSVAISSPDWSVEVKVRWSYKQKTTVGRCVRLMLELKLFGSSDS